MPSDLPSPYAIEKHNKEIHENLRHGELKPALQREYLRFYRHLADRRTEAPARFDPLIPDFSRMINSAGKTPAATVTDRPFFPDQRIQH